MIAVAEIVLLVLLAGGFVAFVQWLWRDDPTWRLGRGSAEAPEPGRIAQERVLFVCTHNSARSQMAEAILRHAAGSRFDVASAGTAPTRVHPLAELAMDEIGLSLASHRAKSLGEAGSRWDYVVTVCDTAYEQCPEFPAKTCRLHWSVEDPSRATGPAAQQLEAFRRVRDDLAERIRRWIADRPQGL